MKIINKKLKHLIKNFGFKKDQLCEIKKMYCQDFFDPNDKYYKKLLEISKQLCEEYSCISLKMDNTKNCFRKLKLFFRKRKILKLLFPISGFFANVGDGINAVIGLVDFKGIAFLNSDVHFLPYSLVTCKNYTIFGLNIDVGNNSFEQQDGKIKLNKIVIGKDTWICAGVTIKNGVIIGDRSVVGAGAIVEHNIENDCLAVGRPCKAIAKIDKTNNSTKKIPVEYTKNQLEIIFENAKQLGFKGKLKPYKKALSADEFNSINITLGKMYMLTHKLCRELNSDTITPERKQQILKILIPNQGKNFTVGKNFYVDLLGTTVVGDNVTIADNVKLAGNVFIENNVYIGNNTLLFASGHRLYHKGRRTSFSLKYGLYEFSKTDVIKICEHVHIGNNVVVAPSTIVKQNIKDNVIVTNKKIIE